MKVVLGFGVTELELLKLAPLSEQICAFTTLLFVALVE